MSEFSEIKMAYLEKKKLKCVVEAIKGIEKSFNKRFKSITRYNGAEFMDEKSIEKLVI